LDNHASGSIIEAYKFPTISKLSPEWQRTSILEAVFDQLWDALLLYSPDMVITGVNRAAEKLFRRTSEEMIGRRCQDVFRCSVGESGCGVVVGLNQAPGAPHAYGCAAITAWNVWWS
jgi:PAS domain-containing protein